jgi:erythromycin esterase-like protein/predicted phosphoribosyltransferase
MRFHDRRDAGRQLAARLSEYAGRSDVVVLALPRGGVPVAHEVAIRLGAPLDVLVVRKLGVPGHEEFAMGAIASGGVRVLSQATIADLRIPETAIDQVTARERRELERREHLFRGNRPRLEVRSRTVIVVDDGLATGATMEAAVQALRSLAPAAIVVAVPIGAAESCERLVPVADRVVCLATPAPFSSVGQWYQDFSQTSDAEVRRLLAADAPVPPPARGNPGRIDVAGIVRARGVPLTGAPDQYDALIDGVGDARVVLLGEATHGTHEFYRERAFITRRLIVEKGFAAVAVEADWPDAYRVNRYVRGTGGDGDAAEALSDFQRFPAWMWRNADVLDFAGWLRSHNEARPPDRRAGFYGLDLYSLRASTQAVLAYLDKIDPDGARRARTRYACFDQFGGEQEYGYATTRGLRQSCEREAVGQLVELHRRRADYASRDGRVAADEFFFAEQNARLVKNAEQYYRTMFAGRAQSWNVRDRHMAETLGELLAFLDRVTPEARVIVWAHNSHLGDARATEMGEGGELNLGQLARQTYGTRARLVGFTTYTGTVTAATDWDGPAHRRHVRPAIPGSYEDVCHAAGIPRFMLPLCTDATLASALHAPRLQRAIGVIYRPETERQSHYFHARLDEQFDYVVHFDETRAIEPLERTAPWEAGEVAETYPTGL